MKSEAISSDHNLICISEGGVGVIAFLYGMNDIYNHWKNYKKEVNKAPSQRKNKKGLKDFFYRKTGR